MSLLVWRLLALLILLPGTAHAYIDPGSGMLVIQGLVALVGGIVAFVRNPFAALKRFLMRLRRK